MSLKKDGGGIYQYLPVRCLTIVWPDAQRPLRPRHLKHLCDTFDPDLFDPIHVTAVVKQPDIRHVIDGWHRRSMIEQLYGANEQLPCLIHDDCTTKQRAAEIFREINSTLSRKSPSPLENFKVMVTEEDAAAVAINRTVRKCGLQVASANISNGVNAVASLQFIYSKFGAGNLEKTLTVLKEIWPDDTAAFQAPILVGMSAFLFNYPQASVAKLQTKIGTKFSPGTLVSAARAIKQARAIPMAQAAMEVLESHSPAARRAPKDDIVVPVVGRGNGSHATMQAR